ncbi:MAG TPA: acylphosphatase [Candidatus Limnocylindria bacterium]|nr:acylphosphatase [Candidatus Limnocylindria bacterium]
MSQGQRLEARVHGRVQGVGFRWFVRRQAIGLGLTGWVANEPGGSVRVVAEGEPAALEELAGLLRRGPDGAAVERVDVERLPFGGSFARFEIRSGSHDGD